MPWIHESSKICFFFGIWHRDWARPWRPWRPWLSEAINVMSMIRAAGRAGDVPKALELLRQLELSEKCLWPSEHIGTQNETQNEPILSPFWVHSHHLYIRFMTLILLWFILVLLLLNLMWRRCNCCQGRSILRPTIVHLRPHVFFSQGLESFGSSSNPWRFPARPVWPAATAAVQTRCCSKWSRWGMWMWSRTIRPMLRILRLVSKSRVNWELANICRGT